MERTRETQMPTHYEKRILRVLQYIHENPAGDLSLDALADVAAMSRFHWHRVFQAMTGETCAQAVRRLRMLRAAIWLTSKDWTIAEVASRVGYPNLQSFSRAFRESHGVSPGAFQKNGGPYRLPAPAPKGIHKMFDVELTDAPRRRLAALMHKGPYSGSGQSYQKVAQAISKLELWPNVRGMAGVYYDDPNVVAEKDLRCHAGVILNGETALPEGLEEVSLIGGRYAVLHYKGPYTALKVAYDHLYGNWLPNSGIEPMDAPSYEVYLNDPSTTAPGDLLTDIHLPLAA